MTDVERLYYLFQDIRCPNIFMCNAHELQLAEYLAANGVTVQQPPRPLEDWGEDYGDVLWWRFPVEEPPYVGSPLDEQWTGYHTHWTPIVVPEPPKEV